jgi:hypothetical protein
MPIIFYKKDCHSFLILFLFKIREEIAGINGAAGTSP